MTFNDDLKYTLRGIKERKLRSWLTILGIVIGVAAIVGLITMAQGLQNAVSEQFESFGISNLRVVPGNLRGPPTGNLGFDISAVEIVERVKAVEYVNKVLLNFVPVEFNKKIKILPVIGYDPDLSDKGFIDLDLDLERGSFLKSGQRTTAVVGWNLAHGEFDKDIRLKQKIEILGRDFSVIGNLERTGTNVDDNIYVPFGTAEELFNITDFVNIMVVKIKDGIPLEEAAEDIEKELLKDLNEEEFEVFIPSQILEQFNQILNVIGAVLVAIAMISLVVGGVGIANSMFTSVLERTKQIGIMKAIGARNERILRIFLIEAGIMGLIGGAIGVIIGAALAFAVEVIAKAAGFGLISISLSPTLVIISLLFSITVGIISGVIPAWQASKLSPTEALRYE